MWYDAYKIQFKDIDEGLWVIMIQSNEPPTGLVELQPSASPLEWKGKSDGAQDECLLPTTGTLRLLIENDEDARELQVGRLLPKKFGDRRVVVTREGVIAWQGFLLPETFDQDWVAPTFEIELTVCDMVSALQYVYIDTADTSRNIIQLLHTAYQRVGGELPIGEFLVSDTKLYTGRDGKQTNHYWGSGEFYPSYFIDPSGEKQTAYQDIVEVLLSPYGRLRQIGNRWYVGTSNASTANLYTPNPDGSGHMDGAPQAQVIMDIDDEVAGTKNTESILPSPSKVTLKYKPEDGAVDYSGDDIVKMESDDITGPYSNGPRDMAGLRYMDVPPENLKWPFTFDRHAWVMDYEIRHPRGSAVNTFPCFPTGAQRLEHRSVVDCTRWSQVLEFESGTWAVKKGLVLGGRRYLYPPSYYYQPGSDYDIYGDFKWEVSVDTLRLMRELLSSSQFCLMVKAKSTYADLNTSDEYSPGSSLCVRPYLQIYYSPTHTGTPTHVLRFTPGNLHWSSCNGFFQPTYTPGVYIEGECRDSSLIPVKKFEGGMKFGLLNGRGYISIRVYGGQWIDQSMEKDILFNGGHYPLIATHTILSELDITYSEVVSDATHRLLEWNDEISSTVETKLAGGTEELQLDFKTLAGDPNTAETYLAPRRGFCDSRKAYIDTPRQLLDLGAVSMKNFNLAGLAYPASFRFDGAEYFPLAVGMDCRNNRASLKLIRTL